MSAKNSHTIKMYLFFVLSLCAMLYIAFPDRVEIYNVGRLGQVFYRVHGHDVSLSLYYSAAAIFACALCAATLQLLRTLPKWRPSPLRPHSL